MNRRKSFAKLLSITMLTLGSTTLLSGPSAVAQQSTTPSYSLNTNSASSAPSNGYDVTGRYNTAGRVDSAGRVTAARPSLDKLAPAPSVRPDLSLESATDIESQRERMFNELAEEYSVIDRLNNLVRRVSMLVKPSVIHIEAHKSDPSRSKSYDEAGSGVIISSGGESWVMTNRHVIDGAAPSQILLRTNDGREMRPLRVLADPSTDVAVMKIDAMDLPPARMGNSEDVSIGDFVIAIGSPFGLSHSVTFGVMSAKGRRDLSLGDQKIDLQDFFQTDAAINPGNSGGPLINLRGEVIALNTAIASSSGGSEGIGFAIPINMAKEVADQLIQYGQLRRGYLGVTLDPDFTPAKFASMGSVPMGTGLKGALVKRVRSGSPAALAHLQPGDIILKFDGKSVDNDDHLVAQVGLTPIGEKIPMVIYREGKQYRTDVQLTDLP